jgi:hypothetical protein
MSFFSQRASSALALSPRDRLEYRHPLWPAYLNLYCPEHLCEGKLKAPRRRRATHRWQNGEFALNLSDICGILQVCM